jgi:hypothetical protein
VRYLTVQTLLAIALGVLAAAVRQWISDRALPATWPLSYLLLLLPLAMAVARHPSRSLLPLAAAVPSGAAVTTAAALLLPLDGFWWWYGAASAGALVAAVVFGLLRHRPQRAGQDAPAGP